MRTDEQLGVRVPPEIKAALIKAALDDDRSLTSLTVKILRDWLTERNYLQKEKRK